MTSRIYHVGLTGIIHQKGLAPCQSNMEHIERVKHGGNKDEEVRFIYLDIHGGGSPHGLIQNSWFNL